MAHDVFISHSAKDKTIADAVCATMESHGIRCWIAPRDIVPSQDWPTAILEGIKASKAMVLVFSGHSNESDNVHREVKTAFSKGIPVLPVRTDNATLNERLEFFMGYVHWLDAMTPPIEHHLSQLANSVHAILGASSGTSTRDQAGTKPLGDPALPERQHRLVAVLVASLNWILDGLARLGIAKKVVLLHPEAPANGAPGEHPGKSTGRGQTEDEISSSALWMPETSEDASCDFQAGSVDRTPSVLAEIVHEHPVTGFWADLIVPEDTIMLQDVLRVSLAHALLKPSPFQIEVRVPSSSDSLQYLRLSKLIKDYHLILRIYWLSRLRMQGADRAAFELPQSSAVKMRFHNDAMVTDETAGIVIKGDFYPMIDAGMSAPSRATKQLRTLQKNQRVIAFSPAIRRADGTIKTYREIRLPMAMAPAGVAWIDVASRVDPDGRYTIVVRDPVHNMRVCNVLVAGESTNHDKAH